MRVVLLLCIASLLFAKDLIEYDYELDIYYSNVSAFINVSDENITDATHFSEFQIYNSLFYKSLYPNIFLVELSFHPMSWAGVWYRKKHPSQYEKATINNFNLVKALTAGWEEPYSISFFLGRMMIFRNEKSRHIGKNRAFVGYLVTLGNKSIKDNLDYKDNWLNMEIKLKGTRELEQKDLDWSFRVGYRYHNNKNFVNTFYIGARRSSIDFLQPLWSIRYNSAFDTLLEWSAQTFKLTKASFLIEKKFPIQSSKVTFGIGIGYLYYGGNRYTGDLKEEGVDNHQLILRPNLKW